MTVDARRSGFWGNRRVMVTGGTGFLGGWLVHDLQGLGAEIVALIRDGSPECMFSRMRFADRVRTVQGDLADPALLRRTLCEYEVDTVFHLAAQTLVGIAKTDPVGTLEANVRGTWNLLDAARQAGTKQIVVASSDKAYGSSAELPYREDDALRGEFPYDVSKSCTDLICTMYARTYEVPVAITRCGNQFGGGDLNWSRTVPGLIRATLAGERFVIRSDGKYLRDFLYARDAAHAYMVLAESLASNRSLAGEAFNFSLEHPLMVLDLVSKILEMMGRTDLEPIVQNTASSEIREQHMLAEKARRVLGWSPRYGLDQGLAETIGWYTEFFSHGEGGAAR